MACSDLGCFLMFCVVMVVNVGIFTYTKFNGADTRRLTHGFDYYGRLCGVDEDVEASPYLYWCGRHQRAGGLPNSIELSSGLCVQECPTNTGAMMPCLIHKREPEIHIDHGTGATTNGSVVEVFEFFSTQSVVMMPSMPTIPFGGRYCVPSPSNGTNSSQQSQDFFTQTLRGPLGGLHRLTSAAGDLRHAWLPLLATAIPAVVLSILFLVALSFIAGPCLLVMLICVVLSLSALGIFLIMAWWQNTDDMSQEPSGYQTANPLYHQLAWKDARVLSTVLGAMIVVLALLSLLLTILVVCRDAKFIDDAVRCVHAAWECVCSQPLFFLLHLLLEVLSKLAVVALVLYGVMRLLSTGMVSADSTINGAENKVEGVHRNYLLDWWSLLFMIAWLFGGFWLYQLTTACSQWVVAWQVAKWFGLRKLEYFVLRTDPGADPHGKWFSTSGDADAEFLLGVDPVMYVHQRGDDRGNGTHTYRVVKSKHPVGENDKAEQIKDFDKCLANGPPSNFGRRDYKEESLGPCSSVLAVWEGLKRPGTLVCGAIAIGPTQPLRLVVSASGFAGTGYRANPICGVCECCIGFYSGFLESLSTNVYTEIILPLILQPPLANSPDKGFSEASQDSLSMLVDAAREGYDSALGRGALYIYKCFLFEFVGVLFVGVSCGIFLWWIVSEHPDYTTPTSPNFVADSQIFASVGAVIAGGIACVFMRVFSHTMDVLLYCFVWYWHKGQMLDQCIPDRTQHLVGYHPAVEETVPEYFPRSFATLVGFGS